MKMIALKKTVLDYKEPILICENENKLTFFGKTFLLKYESNAFLEIKEQLLKKIPDCGYIFKKEHSKDKTVPVSVLVFLNFSKPQNVQLSDFTLLMSNTVLACSDCRRVDPKDMKLSLSYILKSITEPFLETNLKTEIIEKYSFFFRDFGDALKTEMSDTQKKKLLNHLTTFEIEFNSKSQDLSVLDKTLNNARNFFYNKKYMVDENLTKQFNRCKKNLNQLKHYKTKNKMPPDDKT